MLENEGIVVPLVTPFTSSGEIDRDSISNLVEHVIAGGANGLFTAGTTGEFEYLSREEKTAIAQAVIKAAKGRAAVYAGVTGRGVEETERILLETLRLKPDCLVLAPLVYHGNRNLPAHMENLAGKAEKPVMLYNNDRLIKPPLRRENIRTGILKRLSGLSGIVGLKDSSGDIRRIRNYLRAVRHRRDFSVLQGDETGILPALESGARGAVPSMGNLFPGLCAQLCRAFSESPGSCPSLQEEISGMGEVLYAGRKKIAAGLKTALYMRGIIGSNKIRDRRQELTGEEEARIKEFLKGRV